MIGNKAENITINQHLQFITESSKELPDINTHSLIRQNLSKEYHLRRYKIIERISGDNLDMGVGYVNLSLVWHKLQQIKEKEMLRQLQDNSERSYAYKEIFEVNSKESIPIHEIFAKRNHESSFEKPSSRHVLIIGRAGIGKTTLCKKIVYEYQERNLWKDKFKWLLWIPLRNLKKYPTKDKPYSLGELLYLEFFLNQPEGVSYSKYLWKIIDTNPDEVLIILDGWDEIAYEINSTHLGPVLIKLISCACYVILTSNLNTFYRENEYVNLELIGFNEKSTEDYTDRTVDKKGVILKEIKEFIHLNMAAGLSNIPLQLDALCYSWDYLQKFIIKEKFTSITVSDIYRAITYKIWLKYLDRPAVKEQLNKNEENKVLLQDAQSNPGQPPQLDPDEIDQLFTNESTYLEYLAFNGLCESKIEFDNNDFIEAEKYIPSNSKSGLRRKIKQTHFLNTQDDGPNEKQNFYFTHLTLQEYFAALFLSKNLTKNNLSRIITNGFKFEMVLYFLAGLLRSRKVDLEKLFLYLCELEKQDIIKVFYPVLMIRCLDEANNAIEKSPFCMDLYNTVVKFIEEILLKDILYYTQYSRLSQQLKVSAYFKSNKKFNEMLIKAENKLRVIYFSLNINYYNEDLFNLSCGLISRDNISYQEKLIIKQYIIAFCKQKNKWLELSLIKTLIECGLIEWDDEICEVVSFSNNFCQLVGDKLSKSDSFMKNADINLLNLLTRLLEKRKNKKKSISLLRKLKISDDKLVLYKDVCMLRLQNPLIKQRDCIKPFKYINNCFNSLLLFKLVITLFTGKIDNLLDFFPLDMFLQDRESIIKFIYFLYENNEEIVTDKIKSLLFGKIDRLTEPEKYLATYILSQSKKYCPSSIENCRLFDLLNKESMILTRLNITILLTKNNYILERDLTNGIFINAIKCVYSSKYFVKDILNTLLSLEHFKLNIEFQDFLMNIAVNDKICLVVGFSMFHHTYAIACLAKFGELSGLNQLFNNIVNKGGNMNVMIGELYKSLGFIKNPIDSINAIYVQQFYCLLKKNKQDSEYIGNILILIDKDPDKERKFNELCCLIFEMLSTPKKDLPLNVIQHFKDILSIEFKCWLDDKLSVNKTNSSLEKEKYLLALFFLNYIKNLPLALERIDRNESFYLAENKLKAVLPITTIQASHEFDSVSSLHLSSSEVRGLALADKSVSFTP